MTPTLCIFARAPELGRVKTRLALGIGTTAALAVYRQLLAITARVAAVWPGAVVLHGDGPRDGFAATPLAHLPYRAQSEGGLGRRLRAGMASTVGDGGAVVAIGSDCPGLTLPDLLGIAHLLSVHPAVFGPAGDGGYWALGCADSRALAICTADDLPWSQPELLRVSEQRCREAGIRTARGPLLDDCDTPTDLARCRARGLLLPSPTTVSS